MGCVRFVMVMLREKVHGVGAYDYISFGRQEVFTVELTLYGGHHWGRLSQGLI